MARRRFDAAYYRRYYEDPRTRVAGPAQYERLAAFVAAYLDFLGLPLTSVLDLGCGLAHWRRALAKIGREVDYVGVESSAHLCARYGFERGSVADYRPERDFDLVVCQGVLQYLDDRDAARALANLGRIAGRALYLEVLTQRDWEETADRERTDRRVHLRPAAFYRRRLAKHFVDMGGGVFVARRAGICTFELERRG